MTAISPERAAYDASYRCHGIAPGIPFEELDPADREELTAVTQAAIKASPELAGALATIDELRQQLAKLTGAIPTEPARALLAAPVTYPETDASTVGELLAGILIDEWQTAPRFTPGKTAVYLAAIRAGLIPGVAVGDRIGELDLAAAEALTEAAIWAMGQPQADGTSKALWSMIASRQEEINTAGKAHGLGPLWHEATFTATEILAAIGDTASHG